MDAASLWNADSATHIKIVVVSLLAATLVVAFLTYSH